MFTPGYPPYTYPPKRTISDEQTVGWAYALPTVTSNTRVQELRKEREALINNSNILDFLTIDEIRDRVRELSDLIKQELTK